MQIKEWERIVTNPFRLVRHVWMKAALSAALILGERAPGATPVLAPQTPLTLDPPTTRPVPGTVNLFSIFRTNAAGYDTRESTMSGALVPSSQPGGVRSSRVFASTREQSSTPTEKFVLEARTPTCCRAIGELR